jgi:hypothetical protein
MATCGLANAAREYQWVSWAEFLVGPFAQSWVSGEIPMCDPSGRARWQPERSGDVDADRSI